MWTQISFILYASGNSYFFNFFSQMKKRDDLWINHIQKNKQKPVPVQKPASQKPKSNPEEEEDWEDGDEEIEEISDEEWEDNEDEEEAKKIEPSLMSKKLETTSNLKNEYDPKNNDKVIEEKTKLEEQLKNIELSGLAEKILKLDHPVNLKENFEINPEVKMKYYDDNGLLIDGYDYYQHIAVNFIKFQQNIYQIKLDLILIIKFLIKMDRKMIK